MWPQPWSTSSAAPNSSRRARISSPVISSPFSIYRRQTTPHAPRDFSTRDAIAGKTRMLGKCNADSSTVPTKRQRVRVPEIPMYLDAVLADQSLIGGLEPMLGQSHLRVLTVVGFPTVTTPGILDELNRLAFPYRWSTRAIMLDKTDATRLLTKNPAAM